LSRSDRFSFLHLGKKRIGIIGAGPAGLTAAYELVKAGHEVTVFEASGEVGGMSKTIDLWEQKVDLGPHRFFSSDSRVNKLWLEVVGPDYFMVNRLTRILYRGKFFQYPLKPIQALRKLGAVETVLCIGSYMWRYVRPPKKDGLFDSWVIRRFGYRLYSIFFKTYSEKLWGTSCKDIADDFAAQRIRQLSLFKSIWNGLFSFGETRHRTLVEEFARPMGGTGATYEKMRASIESSSGSVILNTRVLTVLIQENRVTGVELESGEVKEFDHVISTMPLSILVAGITEAPNDVKRASQQLKFRNTSLVYLEIEGRDIFPDNWLYVHSDNLKTGRITNFSNWGDNEGAHTTIVALEYWSWNTDDLWNYSESDMIKLAKSELIQTGLVKDMAIAQGKLIRIPKSYPVYEAGYRKPLKQVEEYLKGIDGLSVIGRYGAFKYNNQDHSILMGMLAAENIRDNTTHDLWSINTDYEVYQERSKITSTGLESIN